MKVTRGNNAARKRWLAGAILLVFSTSCATTGVPTDRALQQSSGDPSSEAASSAARAVDVTGVQIRAEESGKASIVITADGALVDYASFAEHAPPRLVIDPSELPPYRVELTRNSLQTLVSTEVSKPAPVVQEPTELKQAAEPVVSPIESAATVPLQAVQPPAVSPPAAKEETPLPLPKKSAAEAAAKRRKGGAISGPGQEAPPLPSAAAEQPIAPTPVIPQVAATNKRLMLDFKDADLDEIVWKVIREASGLNIVLAHKLAKEKRKVTVRLDNVEWRQALDIILRTLDLSYEQDGNVIYVGSRSDIQKSKDDRAKEIEQAADKRFQRELKNMKLEEEKRRVEKAEEERRRIQEEERRYAEEPLCTKVIHLAHTKAPDVKKHLQKLTTRRGSIELEETSNTLIVNDVQSACLKMAALAKELDAPPKDPFVTKLLPFNYAKAADLKTHLAALKTSQGSVVIDERSSRIIVKDLPETVERIESFLKQIDIPTPQVLIEARIVEASRSFSRSIGIQWGGAGIPTTPGSGTGVTAFGGGGSAGPIQFPGLTGPTTGSPFPPTTGGGIPFVGPVPLALNLPAIASGVSPFVLGATIGSLANRFLVGAQLSAAEFEGKIKTLSSPRVATQDNEEAEIKQGTQVPYTTIDSSGRTVVQFQDAFIKLKVKPHITPDGRVSMKVEAERSFPGPILSGPFGFVFPINTRKATTNILVQNGSTVVIGGLLQSSESIGIDQVPLFGRIPILGWLFKRQSLGPDDRVELLIFLTPSILQESRP